MQVFQTMTLEQICLLTFIFKSLNFQQFYCFHKDLHFYSFIAIYFT